MIDLSDLVKNADERDDWDECRHCGELLKYDSDDRAQGVCGLCLASMSEDRLQDTLSDQSRGC